MKKQKHEEEQRKQEEYIKRQEEDNRKIKEELKRQKAITHKNAIPKAEKLRKFFDLIKNQKEFVKEFYNFNGDTFDCKFSFLRKVGISFMDKSFYSPQYKQNNYDFFVG